MSDSKSRKVLRVALLGGDRRVELPTLPERVALQRFGSQRDRGNGEQRRLLNAIRSGCVDLVVVLVRWAGHSTTNRVRRVCKLAGVPVLLIPGGGSEALRQLADLAVGGAS